MRHPKIEWSEDLRVGDPLLDREHRQLIGLFQQLASPEFQGNPAFVRSKLDELVGLACRHFDHEDALMRRLHYPGITEHQKEHDALLKQINSFIDLLDEGPDPPSPADIVEFVGVWVLDHIGREDHRLGSFLAGTIGLAIPA